MCVIKQRLCAVVLFTTSILQGGVRVTSEAMKAADPAPIINRSIPVTEAQIQEGTEGENNLGLVQILGPNAAGPCPPAYAPDGKTLAIGGGSDQIRLWDISTGEKRMRLKIEPDCTPWVHSLAFSPDGKMLASGDDKGTIRLWDISTRNIVCEMRVAEGIVVAIAFSPDSRTVAAAAGCGKIYIWDAATRKELHRLDRENQMAGGSYGIAFSPDGQMVAAGGAKAAVWDLASGKKLQQFDAEAYYVAFSPDARTLMGAGGYHPPQTVMTSNPPQHPALYFWELASRKERRLLDSQVQGVFTYLVLSPDGRTLVTAGGRRQVCLWEVATGMPRRTLGHYDHSYLALAFSPDGRTLAASALGGQNINVWNVLAVPSYKKPLALKPSTKELEALWQDLASEDASRGYAAICALAHWPRCSVAFLQKRLDKSGGGAIPKAGEETIAHLIADLDQAESALRQKASAELQILGNEAEPALRRAVASNPSPELRRRAEFLLRKVEEFKSGLPTASSLRQLRVLRAIEALEHIATPEVRPVLESLARGRTDDKVIQEAKAALDRLAKQSPPTSEEGK
jgi:hypothetical protein